VFGIVYVNCDSNSKIDDQFESSLCHKCCARFPFACIWSWDMNWTCCWCLRA